MWDYRKKYFLLDMVQLRLCFAAFVILGLSCFIFTAYSEAELAKETGSDDESNSSSSSRSRSSSSSSSSSSRSDSSSKSGDGNSSTKNEKSKSEKVTDSTKVTVQPPVESDVPPTWDTPSRVEQVTDKCVSCICEAIGGCKSGQPTQFGLKSSGNDKLDRDSAYGPLSITRPYWEDAGSPTASGNDQSEFINCANDMNCAANTLKSYMARYPFDCNEDGVVNCSDYAAIHMKGPLACQSPLPTPYQTRFLKCWNGESTEVTSNNGKGSWFSWFLRKATPVSSVTTTTTTTTTMTPEETELPKDEAVITEETPTTENNQLETTSESSTTPVLPENDETSTKLERNDLNYNEEPVTDSFNLLLNTTENNNNTFDYEITTENPETGSQITTFQNEIENDKITEETTKDDKENPVTTLTPDENIRNLVDENIQSETTPQQIIQNETDYFVETNPTLTETSTMPYIKENDITTQNSVTDQPINYEDDENSPVTETTTIQYQDNILNKNDQISTENDNQDPKSSSTLPNKLNENDELKNDDPNTVIRSNEIIYSTSGTILDLENIKDKFSSLKVENITDDCIKCICEAASGCNIGVVSQQPFYGPFRITHSYWVDAGSPNITTTTTTTTGTGDSPFVSCANDFDCAERTVRAYMNKYRYDCNGDGIVNCSDYAAIHNQGPYECKKPLPLDYQYRFEKCAQYLPPVYQNEQHFTSPEPDLTTAQPQTEKTVFRKWLPNIFDNFGT